VVAGGGKEEIVRILLDNNWDMNAKNVVKQYS
jgi:hypothetical protein